MGRQGPERRPACRPKKIPPRKALLRLGQLPPPRLLQKALLRLGQLPPPRLLQKALLRLGRLPPPRLLQKALLRLGRLPPPRLLQKALLRLGRLPPRLKENPSASQQTKAKRRPRAALQPGAALPGALAMSAAMSIFRQNITLAMWNFRLFHARKISSPACLTQRLRETTAGTASCFGAAAIWTERPAILLRLSPAEAPAAIRTEAAASSRPLRI